MARPIIKLIQYILSRKVQLNSWQALIKPWDGFCGPLEVRTHPLPPPDSGASFSSFGIFVFEFWVLRFRDLGASFSRFGCFVLRSSFSSASFSKLPMKRLVSELGLRHKKSSRFTFGENFIFFVPSLQAKDNHCHSILL